MRIAALTLTAALLAACASPETPEQAQARMQAETDSARSAITEALGRWARFVNANQPESLATLYTATGVAMPPEVPAAIGGDSIVARIRPLAVPGGVLTITSTALAVNGPLAVERGTYTYALPAQGRTPAVTITGKYLSHWHRVDGQWKIAENAWNSDAPSPPAPAPTRR